VSGAVPTTPNNFCTRCGAPLRPGRAFCIKCGAPARTQPLAAAAPPAEAHTISAPNLAAAGGMASAAMSVAGVAGAMPWQTIATGEPFDIERFLAAGAMPAAQAAVRASLRTPAIAMLVTSALDLAVALISGQPAALKMVGLRFGMAAVTSVFAMVAGSKAGGLRKVAGVSSMLTGLVQLGSMLYTSFSAIANPATSLMLVPSVISQLSTLVMSVKTAIVGLRS
jgi:hypothetical protein